MAYEVTANRKRPQSFDSLIGQQFVVSTIKNSLEQKRFAHAYLFSGPRGVGKTSSARILAKALNCDSGPTPYPCGECSHCIEITKGTSPDVIEIDGASNTSVNDMRAIKDEVLFPPQAGRYKIYIIDEVHMLSTSAFNALLKTIEEPPPYVMFIFATTEPQKVPATIRSRCQQFHFQLIPLNTIKEELAATAQEMNIKAEEEALFWIAKEATGSMRDAYTLFDQVASFSSDGITMANIEEKLGLAGIDKITALIEPLAQEKPEEAIAHLEALLDTGVSVEQLIKDLAHYMRTLLLLRRGVTNENVLAIQVNQIPSSLVTAYSEEQLEAALDLFLDLYRQVRYSLAPRYELELAVSRLASLHHMTSNVQLVKKIEALQDNLARGDAPIQRVTPPVRKTSEPKQEARTPAPAPVEVKKEEPKKELVPLTKELLIELAQQLAHNRDSLGLVLTQLISCEVSADEAILTFPTQYVVDSAQRHVKQLRSLILTHTGFDHKLTMVSLPPEPKKEAPKEDSLAHNIATLFRGDVIS
ncbi:MAG: DNA polymerase III subunit gamma/tau [Sphaerochaetaceae bacterium]|jgi:DNA polymerase-3 subunit gamma/tau